MDNRLGLSVIMPALNEAANIADTLTQLLIPDGPDEIFVVDGGSADSTVAAVAEIGAARAAPLPRLKCLIIAGARARRLNAGARAAQGEILLFLHADTRLPERGCEAVRAAVARGALWGRFDLRLSGGHPMFRVIEFMINLRSRVSGIATGDQAIFLRRDVFERLGGYAEIPLMEDVELCRRLKRLARPACLRERVVTSSRRWERRGIVRTIVLMWSLRFQYWLGVSPARLARRYR